MTGMSKPTVTIAVSSRALFHMEAENAVWEASGQAGFDALMRKRESEPLPPGSAFQLVRKLLSLNTRGEVDQVEVILLSRNSPAAGRRIMLSAAAHGLNIRKAAFTGGTDRFRYAGATGVDLFLSAHRDDVASAAAHGIAAATLVPRATGEAEDSVIRIAFDGDCVVFDGKSDAAFRAGGINGFIEHEARNAHLPLDEGPFKQFLSKLSLLRAQCHSGAGERIRLGLVTARSAHAHERVVRTLELWGIRFDEAVFADGLAKGPLFKAFRADIAFDDSQYNIDSADSCDVVGGHVPGAVGTGIGVPA